MGAVLGTLKTEPARQRPDLLADPVAAGIEHAVREAAALLAIDGVEGVNVSGLASARGVADAAAIQAEIGLRIRELP